MKNGPAPGPVLALDTEEVGRFGAAGLFRAKIEMVCADKAQEALVVFGMNELVGICPEGGADVRENLPRLYLRVHALQDLDLVVFHVEIIQSVIEKDEVAEDVVHSLVRCHFLNRTYVCKGEPGDPIIGSSGYFFCIYGL